jgi:hypothetical protein
MCQKHDRMIFAFSIKLHILHFYKKIQEQLMDVAWFL